TRQSKVSETNRLPVLVNCTPKGASRTALVAGPPSPATVLVHGDAVLPPLLPPLAPPVPEDSDSSSGPWGPVPFPATVMIHPVVASTRRTRPVPSAKNMLPFGSTAKVPGKPIPALVAGTPSPVKSLLVM